MWTPSNWASLAPFGIGQQRPNNYLEIVLAIRENRDELGFAWRILSQGVCDGCALGTTGLRDWTLDGVHLCNIRLRLLRLNTMGPIDPEVVTDISALRQKSSAELRELGRLAWPMIRRKGEVGFTRISWDDALNLISDRIRASTPDRIGFYLTSRGMPNEAYYAASKAVRAMGSNNIDNAARICHSPSTSALRHAVGVAATTCSYSTWLKSELIVFFGSNVANNQPVATKYLHYAKKNGAKIVVVNSYREPGMEHYWIPSVVESALFGTKLADRFYLVNTGADIAFINGVLKELIENQWYDARFVAEKTDGFAAMADTLQASAWNELEEASGLPRAEMRDFAERIRDAKRAVFVWSMGITQHEHGVANVKAICNLALMKGFVGREGCGLMPIRGHSGVQGGAEMGAYATAFPGGRTVNAESAKLLAEYWGFEVSPSPGLIAPEMIDRAHAGEMDLLFAAGGNFLEVLPDPAYVAESLRRVPLRVHMDLVLSTSMLEDAAEAVIVLPAATRYETPGGVTQTSTERRVIFSPEIPGRRLEEARPEWEVFFDLARRVRSDLAAQLTFPSTANLRKEIARVIPTYDGIQHLAKQGDQFQYGGPDTCAIGSEWNFPTADGKANFATVTPRFNTAAPDTFRVSTRRGKQFNSMVQEETDALTGAPREAVFMASADAEKNGLADGETIDLYNEFGDYRGCVFLADVKPGNLQVHWPEGNVLIARDKRDPEAGVPDYNATVRIRKVNT